MKKEDYLKKFHELDFDIIKNGLGIITKLNIDFDKIYSRIGEIKYNSNKKLLFAEETINEKVDFIVRRLLDNPILVNKLDYLHAALRDVRVLVITENGEYIVNREIVGNQYSHLIIYIVENVDATIYIATNSCNNNINNTSVEANSDNFLGKIFTDFLDVFIEDNSDVYLVELRNIGGFIYSRKNIIINNKSNVYWTNIEGHSNVNITFLNSKIYGENSGSIMSNLVLSNSSEYNIFTRTDHFSSNSKSLMQSRAIIKNSKVILRGLVFIGNNAFNVNGYQKNDMLLLDNFSRAVSIPDLEICNNEVKCTHGSTITRLDTEKIFYLQSRGLSKEDSERLLLKGFYEKILLEIPSGLRENISSEIERILFRYI